MKLDRRPMAAARRAATFALAAFAVLAGARANAETTDITYNGRIGRLLQDKCITCHRVGGVAPFSMETYEETKLFSALMKVEVEARNMPPWNASPDQHLDSVVPDPGDTDNFDKFTFNFGPGDNAGKGFVSPRLLTEEEKNLLIYWIELGAPEGDATDAPAPRAYPDDWELGQPDIELTQPVPWTLKQGDPDTYRCFVIPTGQDQERVISGMEFRPSNNKIAHHAILYLDPQNNGPERDAQEDGPNDGYTCFGGPEVPGTLGLGGWAPGGALQPFSEELGILLPRGSNIIMQMHYSGSTLEAGEEETDQTRIGLKFAKDPSKTIQLLQFPFITTDFEIPPLTNDYRVPKDRRNFFFALPFNAHLVASFPHMHMFGRKQQCVAVLPNGTIIPLMNVDHWDFDWQNHYIYNEPIALPAGTTIFLDGHYDNPTDAPIFGGESSTEEMLMIGLALTSDAPLPGLGGGGIPKAHDHAPPTLNEMVVDSTPLGNGLNRVVLTFEFSEPIEAPDDPAAIDFQTALDNPDGGDYLMGERITSDSWTMDGSNLVVTFNAIPPVRYGAVVNAFHGIKDLAGNFLDTNDNEVGGELADDSVQIFSGLAPATITKQPQDQSVKAGENVIFGVGVAGDTPYFIQWFKTDLLAGKQTIFGATQLLYQLQAVNFLDGGFYSASVGNAAISPSNYLQTPLAGLTILQSTEPNSATFSKHTIPLAALAGQDLPISITMRNTSRLTWSSTQGYALDIVSDPGNLFGGATQIAFQSVLDIAPANNGTFPFKATLRVPETPGTYPLEFRMSEDGTRFGSTVLASVTVDSANFVTDFGNNAQEWIGGVGGGSASTALTAGGLCMSVVAAGDNSALWVSPEGYLPLVNDRLYEIKVAGTTTATAADSIPLWGINYDNFYSNGTGNNYGGSSWYLDVAGGANGLGRATGRTEFRTYAAPNAALTQQWQGLVDADNSAFSASADAFNDMRLFIRVLDFASGGYYAGNDAGTICVKNLAIRALPMSSLISQQVWGPSINTSTHAAQTLEQLAEGAGVAFIDDPSASAQYQLAASGAGSQKTLLPYDPSQADSNSQLYPVSWASNQLLKATLRIRSAAPAVEGTDPVDAIFVMFDTTTNELGQFHFTTSGSAGNMLRAASPRRAATTGGQSQPYVGFFYTHNATLGPAANAARLRPLGLFMNNAQLAPGGSGADPFIVDGMTVENVTIP